MEKMIDCMVKRIWNDFINEDYCFDFKETREADRQFANSLRKCDLSEEIKKDLDDLLTASTAEHEKQGFVLGFKEAIKMLQQAD